jgi:hypothetical protein
VNAASRVNTPPFAVLPRITLATSGDATRVMVEGCDLHLGAF